MASLGLNRYGKKCVRLLRRHGAAKQHEVSEISVDLMLEGTFERAYAGGDNSQVIPTDTIKNAIIALSHKQFDGAIEDFAMALGRHFLSRHGQVDRVYVEIRQRPWKRVSVAGTPSAYTFEIAGSGEPFTKVLHSAAGAEITSGVTNWLLLNSSGSGFKGFAHPEYTTLQEAEDRILCTAINAAWKFISDDNDFDDANVRILDAVLKIFARHHSPSLQRTVYEMGDAALHAAHEISEIEFELPNRHYFPAELDAFGIDNRGIIQVPVDEPYGQIKAVIRR